MTLTSPRKVEVGRYYRVPCVLMVIRRDTIVWVPVIGTLHEDAEIIKFNIHHFHSDGFLKRLGTREPFSPNPASTALRTVVTSAQNVPVLRRRRCWRQMPDFPWETAMAKYLPELEAAYEGCRVDPEHPVCPHRGFLLVGVPNEDGVVVCSGHRLSWNLRNGELVRRTSSGNTAAG